MRRLTALGWASILVAFVAAGVSIKAASIDVRDNQDEFIRDIALQGWWTMATAVVTAIAVVLQALDRLLSK